jgi:hypothetical protein
MINCEFCEVKSRSQSGMAMHVRAQHKDKWNKSLTGTFSAGFDMGTREPGTYYIPTGEQKKRKPAVVGKGEKKPEIHQDCPWCDYKSKHPPGLSHHIRAHHPKKWKGRLSITLGRPMTRSDKYLESHSRAGKKYKTRKSKLESGGNHVSEDARYYINCCPNCGTSLVPYYLAAGINAKRHAK